MDSALDDNQVEFAVDVCFVSLHMLSHRDCLLNEHVEVLWEGWSGSLLLEDSQDLLASDESDLRDTVLISQSDTDLRRGHSFLGVLYDQFSDSCWCHGCPRWWLSLEWQSAS